MKVEILRGEMRVTDGARVLKIPAISAVDAQAQTLVVSLDCAQTWDPPGEGSEITLEDLQKMAEAIERACGRLGIEIEFD